MLGIQETENSALTDSHPDNPKKKSKKKSKFDLKAEHCKSKIAKIMSKELDSYPEVLI